MTSTSAERAQVRDPDVPVVDLQVTDPGPVLEAEPALDPEPVRGTASAAGRTEARREAWLRAAQVYRADIERVVVTEEQIQDRIVELAEQIAEEYDDREVLLVGVLKGAVMFMADFARALPRPVQLEFMAVSSYGASTSSSGVVRILKDLDRDITGKHVLVVEDIIDSGLTLSWLLRNLASRGPASVEVVALFRKPAAVKVPVAVRYVGFDIANEFVVGYGLDYAERYRDMPYVGVLKPEVYSD